LDQFHRLLPGDQLSIALNGHIDFVLFDHCPPTTDHYFWCCSTYAYASRTLCIFSASSSGISISNSSSKRITSSTRSSESAPRSSIKRAFSVTSASSTPNSSTIICLILSCTSDICSPVFITLLKYFSNFRYFQHWHRRR